MEGVGLGVLANILRTYAIYRLMELLYEPKNIRKIWKFLVYAGFVLMTSGGYYLFHNTIINLITNILGLIFIVLCYQGSLMKNIVIVVCTFTINALTECLVIFTAFRSLEISELVVSLIECVVSIFIFLEVALLERTISVKEKEFRLPLHIWLCMLIVSVINVCIMQERAYAGIAYGEKPGIVIVGTLIVTLLIFYLYGALENYYKDKSDKERFKQKVDIYGSQLDIMSESYEKIRMLRHDMKHHLMELKYLIDVQDTEKAVQYIEEMEKHLVNETEYAASGNKEIDSTLNYLLGMAEKKQIQTDVHVSIPEKAEIHNFSLNVILGNLLENAIEAAEKSAEKYLRLDISVKQGIFYIKIQNSYDGEINLENNKFITGKADKSRHGIGVESVRRIVEESGGIMKIDWQDKLFSVDIFLHLSEG